MKLLKPFIIIFLGILPDLTLGHARLRVANQDGTIPRLISRDGSDALKGGDSAAVPCGPNSVRGNNPVVLTAGEPIVLPFEETINHVGNFLLNFSEAGEVNWITLETIADPNRALAGAADQYSFGVAQEVLVPNTPCTDCTLQFVQDMGGANHYKSCVDIIITTPDAPPPAQPTGFTVTK